MQEDSDENTPQKSQGSLGSHGPSVLVISNSADKNYPQLRLRGTINTGLQ